MTEFSPKKTGVRPNAGRTSRPRPVPTCEVCGATGGESAPLLRLAMVGGQLLPVAHGNNKGAKHVCVAAACLQALPEAGDFLELLPGLSKRRILDTLGLARRQGSLVMGDDAHRYFHDDAVEDGCVGIVATDVSEATQARLKRKHVFSTMEELGKAVGVGRAGVLSVQPGSLAEQAGYWLRVWYESQAAVVS